MVQLAWCVGTTWNAGVQGADANGHYTAATVNGPVAPANGNNFSIKSGWSLSR